MRTELLKLSTTRGPWVLVTGAVGLTAALAVSTVLGAGRDGRPSIGTAGAALAVLDSMSRGSLAALVLGVLVTSSEYRYRTLTASLLQQPRRWTLVRAKVLAGAAAGLALGLAAATVAASVGVAGGAFAPGLLNADVVLHAAGLVVTYPAYAAVGVAVGALLAVSQPAAVLLPLAWVVVVEDLLEARLPAGADAWTIGGTTAALQNSATTPRVLPVWLGAVVLTGYVLLLVLVAGNRVARRDVA